MPSIAENLARVEESLASACRQAGRRREEVALIAVSKTHPVSCLMEALEAGQRVFGENRVQEFEAKSEELTRRGYAVQLGLPGEQSGPESALSLSVHLIGHLQSNKAARAAERFTTVDTLDSLRLAERLHEAASRGGRVLPVLIEIKLSDEPAKEGLAPESRELALLLERLPELSSLRASGLMTVAPLGESPQQERARSCFRRLRVLRDALAGRHRKLPLEELSMGMSGDYAVAIEEGSTQVRIGTAIFGARPRPV